MKTVTFALVLSLVILSSAQWLPEQWKLPLQEHPEVVDYQDQHLETDSEIPAVKTDQFDLSDFLQNPLKTVHRNVRPYWFSHPFAMAPVAEDLPTVDAVEHETDPEIPAVKTNKFDLSDFLQNHLKTVHTNFGPFLLGHPFAMAPVGEDLPPVRVGDAGCHDCNPWQSVFGKIFGNAFKKHLIPINTTIFEHLPPNYKNSTSHTHNIDGSKVVVNQTIHKKTGDDFHHFFHHKVIHVQPHVETEEEKEIEKVTPEAPVVTKSSTDEPSFGIATGENEVNTDGLGSSYDTKLKAKPLLKRSVDDVFKKNNEISFPPADTNKFPHSMANNKFMTPQNSKDDGKVSRSWVYKDMGGKSYLYKLSHKNSSPPKDPFDETPVFNRDAETVGPIRPPDLAGDTRVNPDGSESQQGFSMVEPEAEVFNLTLVIKEAESRANAD